MPTQRGIALILVLWMLVLLGVIAASFTKTTRTETQLAFNTVDGAKAESIADAAVYRAIWDLATPASIGGAALLNSKQFEKFLREAGEPVEQTRRMIARDLAAKTGEDFLADPVEGARQPWAADGTPNAWAFGGAEVEVSIQDEGGKVDINTASDDLLRALLVSVEWTDLDGAVNSLDQAGADALVDAIVDFRDPDDLRRLNGAEDDDYAAAGYRWDAKDAPFEAVAELHRVFGMTAALYAQLEPLVTVYSGQPGVDPRTAPPGVLRALPGYDEVALEAVLAGRREVAAGGTASAAPQTPASFKSGSRRNVVTIRAVAATPGGAVFIRKAVVGLAGSRQKPFHIYSWSRGRRSPSLPGAPPTGGNGVGDGPESAVP